MKEYQIFFGISEDLLDLCVEVKRSSSKRFDLGFGNNIPRRTDLDFSPTVAGQTKIVGEGGTSHTFLGYKGIIRQF